jgi:hypothetical protein
MRVYTFVDSRAVDRYEDFQLFAKREDAEALRESFGSDAKFFNIDEVKIIE